MTLESSLLGHNVAHTTVDSQLFYPGDQLT